MRVREPRDGVLEVTGGRAEISAVFAAARMAHDLMVHDANAPESGMRLLAAALRDYDAACARLATATGTAGPPETT